MAHPCYDIAAYLIFPIGALHMKTPPQTLTISSKAAHRLLAIGDIDTLTSRVYDRPLAITPPKNVRVGLSHLVMFLWKRRRRRNKNIDVKRKSGCQRQLSLFFFTRKQIPATHFVKKHIHIHTMPSHPSSQISTDHKTSTDEPEHSIIDPGEKASSDTENDDDEKSTKPLPDGGQDAWLNVLGTHLIYISTWDTYFCPAFLNHT